MRFLGCDSDSDEDEYDEEADAKAAFFGFGGRGGGSIGLSRAATKAEDRQFKADKKAEAMPAPAQAPVPVPAPAPAPAYSEPARHVQFTQQQQQQQQAFQYAEPPKQAQQSMLPTMTLSPPIAQQQNIQQQQQQQQQNIQHQQYALQRRVSFSQDAIAASPMTSSSVPSASVSIQQQQQQQQQQQHAPQPPLYATPVVIAAAPPRQPSAGSLESMPPQTPVSTQHVPVVPTPMPASHDQIHANATGSGVRSSVAGSLHHSSDFVQIAAPATHALDHSFSGHARSQDAVYDSRAHVQSSLFESPASSRGSSAEMIRTSSVPYAAGEPLQTAHASSSSSYMMHSTNSQLGAGSSDSQQSFAANVDTMRAGSSTALTSVSIPERMEQMRKLSTTNPPAGSNKSSDPGGANRGRGASPLSKLSYNMNDVDTHSAESPRVSAVGNPNATVIPHQSALNMSTGMTRNLSDDNAARLPSSPTDGRISVSNARRSVDMGRAPQSPVSPSNATRGPSPVFRSATQPPTLTSNSGPNSGPGSGSGSGVFSPRTTSSADDSALSSNPVMEFIGEVGYWGGGGSSAILSYAKCDSSQSGMWFDGRISIPESQEDPPNSESSMEASFRSQPTQSQSQSQSQSQYLQQSQSSQSSQPVQQAQSSAGMHSSATREAPADLSQLTMMLDVYQAAMDRKAGVWNGIASSNSLMQPSDPSCHDDSYSNSRSSTGTPSRTPLSGNSTGSAPSPVPLTSKLHQRVIAKTANSGYSQQYTTSPGVPSPRQQSNTSLPGVRSSVSFHADNCMANDVTILDLLTGIGQIRRWTEAEIQSDVKAFESQRLRTVSDLFALSNSSWRGLPVPAIVKDSVRLALGMQIEDASTSTLEDSTATRAEQVV